MQAKVFCHYCATDATDNKCTLKLNMRGYALTLTPMCNSVCVTCISYTCYIELVTGLYRTYT